MVKQLLLGACAIALSACASVKVEDYAANEPALVAETFFNGKLEAHGILKNRSGKVIRYFTASIDAWWEDGVGTLDEEFLFDDGERQKRKWTLQKTGDNEYRATAADVIGDGSMKVSGNALFLDYVLRVPYDGDSIDLTVDDRMYRVSDKILINESIMTKFGFEAAELTLVIIKI